MQNTYESPDVIQIGQAPSMILGEKAVGWYDYLTGCECCVVVCPYTDIDE